MSLTSKQVRFAHEFLVDHNAKQAALRAGYSVKGAKQIGSRNLANPAVRQLVGKLTKAKQAALGFEAVDAMAMGLELWESATVLQPRIWKGLPVVWTDEGGVERMVMELRSPAAAASAAALVAKLSGATLAKSPVEVSGEVVYTLSLDRDLSEEEEA